MHLTFFLKAIQGTDKDVLVPVYRCSISTYNASSRPNRIPSNCWLYEQCSLVFYSSSAIPRCAVSSALVFMLCTLTVSGLLQHYHSKH